MEVTTHKMDYKDRAPILVVIGALLLIVGLAAAFLGPLEMYCFYLFSEGGRFFYEGFGFGSFMFGNIACQIIGYYLIAMAFIPLGYGHLKIRRWARPLSLAGLGFWLVVGVPLSLLLLFILFASKDLSPVGALVGVICVGLSYLVVPGLLIRFYRSRDVRLTFETRDPRSVGIENLPVPVLILGCLYVFYIIVLHVLIFFNGIFPLFGVYLTGLQGILVIDILSLCLALLVWVTFRLQAWAWWGSLVFLGGLTVSVTLTLARSSYLDILSNMGFPPREMAFLDGLPFQGSHFAVLIGIPLFLTLGLIVYSKRYFGTANPIPDHSKSP